MQNVVRLVSSSDTQSFPKPTKAFQAWKARILDTERPWSESDIIYFRKAIGASGLKSSVERARLFDLFRIHADKTPNRGFDITQEHSDKGAAYLLRQSLKLDGTARKQNKFGRRELLILKDCSAHLFVGLYQPQSHLEYYLPIYRAVSLAGESFEYVGATYELIVVLG